MGIRKTWLALPTFAVVPSFSSLVAVPKQLVRPQQAIEDEDQVQLLVYMTSSIDLLYQLKAEFEEQRFPIALVTARSFCMSPLATRMYSTRSLGGQKATLEDVLAAVPRRKRVPPGE